MSAYRTPIESLPKPREMTPEEELHLEVLKVKAPTSKRLVAGRVVMLALSLAVVARGHNDLVLVLLNLGMIAFYGWPLLQKWRLSRELAGCSAPTRAPGEPTPIVSLQEEARLLASAGGPPTSRDVLRVTIVVAIVTAVLVIAAILKGGT